MADGLKRLALPVAAVAAVLLLAFALAAWLLDRNALRQSVEAQIKAATGLQWTVAGDTSVSVFPGGAITFRKVNVGEDGRFGLTVEELTANLRLLPLLLHRFEIADIVLTQPQIVVRYDAEGKSNWSPLIERLAQKMAPGASNPVSFSEVRVQGGTLTYLDPARNVSETATGVDLSLAWPSISRSFTATGQFDWRGERVDGSASIADFAAALGGERTGLKLRVAAAPFKFAFDGSVASRATLIMDGTLTADAPSLREALRWSGRDIPADGGLGRFAMKARANIVNASIALTDVNVELDGNVAEGVLSFSSDGRQTLQGTLATEQLDLTPYVNTVRLLANGSREWNRQSFDLRGLSGVDLDLRLSAARASVRNTKIGRIALGANIRGGGLTLTIGEAQIYSGIVKGSVGVARTDGRADVKAQLQLNDVDLEACMADLFDIRRLTGRGNLSIALDAQGSSAYGLAQTLGGTISVTGLNGALSGFNVEQLLRRLERRPLSGTGDFRGGRTPFDRLVIQMKARDGVVTAENVRLDGPTVRLTIAGAASVPQREYDMKGVASLVSATDKDAPPAFELPFVIQGPWEDPLIFPDSESLLRRSPASAPLLDAVRERGAREAIKSAIDRLTGGRIPPAPASAPPPAATETPPAASN
jgi:AsmA protein